MHTAWYVLRGPFFATTGVLGAPTSWWISRGRLDVRTPVYR